MIRRVAWMVMGACLALTPAARGQVPVRTEIHPVDSGTLTQTEFLTGGTLAHPCVERGATIGDHPEAHRQALADVTAFLRAALRLP